MSEKDLMIGDYVICYNVNKRKILAIFDGGVNVLGFFEQVPIEEIKPIPITSGILEKNGFKQRYWNGMYYQTFDLFLDDKEQISVGLGRHSCFCRKKNDRGNVAEVEIYCDYVHELQHALRLCNIDKEIEL